VFFCLCVVLVVLSIPLYAALNVIPDSLEGTEYDFERGLSDKQLAMMRWIAHIAQVCHGQRLNQIQKSFP
jgi:hypothetical protein